MRDGTRAALGQRVGVGMWLAIGLVLALLAFQTTLVSSQTIESNIGAGAAPAQAAADIAAPQLPDLAPGQTCTPGSSECPPIAPVVPVVPTPLPPPPPPGVTPIVPPPDGSAIPCGGTTGIADTATGLRFTQVDDCTPEVEALLATCTITQVDFGIGPASILISMDSELAVGDTVTTTATVVDVQGTESRVFEQYECAGETVTIGRNLGND